MSKATALAGVVFLAATWTSGQMRPGTVEVGVASGRLYGGKIAAGATRLLAQPTEVDDQLLKGAWLGAQLSPRVGLELAVRRARTSLVERAAGVFASQRELAKLDVATLEVLALWSFPRGNFGPYLGAGVGLANLDIDADDTSLRDDDRICLGLASGARFFVARWVGVRFDLRARGVYLGHRWQKDEGWRDGGRWLWNGETQVGIFFSFGDL